MRNSSSPIATISDTALGVAFCCAIESDRGERIIHTVAKKNLDSAGWGIVTCICIIDSLIQKFI